MNDTGTGPTGEQSQESVALAEIESRVAAYVQSVRLGSASMGAEVFDTEDSTIFIHPRGTERGWNAITSAIYAFFDQTFSLRDLTITDGPHIFVHGDAAVADFEWDFAAAFREDGAPLHTTGRETQVYSNIPGKGWRIVHVHYSGPPVTGEREGF